MIKILCFLLIYWLNIIIMIFKYYYIFIACSILLVFSLACGKASTVEEKFNSILPPDLKYENKSITALNRYNEEVQKNLKRLTAIKDEFDTEVGSLESKFKGILEVDLLDENLIITEEESKKFSNFFIDAEKLKNRIQAADITAILAKINDLQELADQERRRTPTSDKVKKLADEVKSFEQLVLEPKSKVDEFLDDLKKWQSSLKEKIDDAAKNFGKHFGDRRRDLEEAITKVDAAKSLKDIDDVLKSEKFFSLTAEIEDEVIHGKSFFEKLDEVKEEIIFSIDNARIIKDDIENNFNVADQAELETLARKLDQMLENDDRELEKLAESKGIISALKLKQNEVHEILEGPRPAQAVPGMPPPPPVFSAKPNADIKFFKTKINGMSGNELTRLTSANPIFTAAINKVRTFYNNDKLTAIDNELKRLKDEKSYSPTYQTLLKALQPYTIEGLKNLLDSDGAVGSNDEVKFNENFEKLIKMVGNTWAVELQKSKDEVVKERMSILNGHFKNLTHIDQLMKKLQEIEGTKKNEKDDIVKVCNELNNFNYFITSLNCADIGSEFESDLASGKISIVAVSNAKNKIRTHFLEPIEEVSEAKNKTEFLKAIEDLNSRFVVGHRIGITAFPNDHDYTMSSLTDQAINLLGAPLNIKDRGDVSYKDVIQAYAYELDPSMSVEDFEILKNSIKKGSGHPLENLNLILSLQGYKEVTKPFVTKVSEEERIKNMREAVLGYLNGNGILALEQAVEEVNRALDEVAVDQAVIELKKFFKDSIKTKLDAVLTLTAQVPDLDKQIQSIKSRVEQNTRYKPIGTLALFDHAAIDNINVLEKDPPNWSLVGYSKQVPKNLKARIFNMASDGSIQVESKFTEMKHLLKLSLEALLSAVPEPATPLNKNDKTIIQPMVNAFGLLFNYPIKRLNELKLDGTDDDILSQIIDELESVAKDYVKKFTKFKSVVGEFELPGATPLVKRVEIQYLENLKAKLDSAISTHPSIDEIKNIVEGFLQ